MGKDIEKLCRSLVEYKNSNLILPNEVSVFFKPHLEVYCCFFFLSPAIIRRLRHWGTATLCIIIKHFFGNCWANFLNCAYLKFAISYFELPHADVLLQPMRADYKAVEVLSLKNSTKSKKKKKSLWLQSQGFRSLMFHTVPIVCMRILMLKRLQSS